MLPNKSSAADPVPTRVLKQLADDVSPFLIALINRSLSAGVVRSLRLISNLSVISKLIERLVKAAHARGDCTVGRS